MRLTGPPVVAWSTSADPFCHSPVSIIDFLRLRTCLASLWGRTFGSLVLSSPQFSRETLLVSVRIWRWLSNFCPHACPWVPWKHLTTWGPLSSCVLTKKTLWSQKSWIQILGLSKLSQITLVSRASTSSSAQWLEEQGLTCWFVQRLKWNAICKCQAAASMQRVLLDFQIYDRRLNSLCLLCGVLILCSGIPTLLLQADLSKSLRACWAPPPQPDPCILDSTSVQALSNFLSASDLPALGSVAISSLELLAHKMSAEEFITLRCN